MLLHHIDAFSLQNTVSRPHDQLHCLKPSQALEVAKSYTLHMYAKALQKANYAGLVAFKDGLMIGSAVDGQFTKDGDLLQEKARNKFFLLTSATWPEL